jgi:hypothetical protein
VTPILHSQTISISFERSLDNVIVKLGVVGPILWVALGLSTPISAWKVVKKLGATPWFLLAPLIFLFPLFLFFQMISLNYRALQIFAINARVWLLTGILYRLQMFPKAIELALAEVAPRQG